MDAFLQSSQIIDYTHPDVAAKAHLLAQGCDTDIQIATRCFAFVKDEIRHTGDAGHGVTTLRASEVLEHQTGWCYAKSHLLAALLRANGIPTALCYQRLSLNDDGKAPLILHGLNAVYLKDFGWYRVDARGNKEGVDAQFDPPKERLAFVLNGEEYDLKERYAQPLPVVVEALQRHKNYTQMMGHFPDLSTIPKEYK